MIIVLMIIGFLALWVLLGLLGLIISSKILKEDFDNDDISFSISFGPIILLIILVELINRTIRRIFRKRS